MAEPATKAVPVKTGEAPTLRDWSPIESLRREMSSLLENFDRGYMRRPSVVRFSTWSRFASAN